ncbi:hypothetical protein BC835DRAFT_1279469, partial [Cytidiella melzeri]
SLRRSTYIPGCAVLPRVSLVDHNAVCRKLSSKLLQMFGCAIDVAVDRIGAAVNKMKISVSATSLIRQFDLVMHIISMTSNLTACEIIKYSLQSCTIFCPSRPPRTGS